MYIHVVVAITMRVPMIPQGEPVNARKVDLEGNRSITERGLAFINPFKFYKSFSTIIQLMKERVDCN
jgi:hypothetical protein